MQHSIYNHTPEFTTELLFSYLGGISGGWLGISLLEFCAFLEGLLSVGVYTLGLCPLKKGKKKKNKNRSARKNSLLFQRPPNPVGPGKVVLLGVPMATRSGKTVQVVPYAYY